MKRKILSFVCALLLMGHSFLKPINRGFIDRIAVVSVASIIVLTAGLFFTWITGFLRFERREECYKKHTIPTDETQKKEIIHVSGEKIEKEERIDEDVDELNIAGDACVVINVDKNSNSSIKIIGDKSFVSCINLKIAEKAFIFSHSGFSFKSNSLLRDKPLNLVINVKQLNSLTISGKVYIEKIYGYDYHNIPESDPPINDEEKKEVRLALYRQYQQLPILKIITKGNSKIFNRPGQLPWVSRKMELFAYDKSQIDLFMACDLEVNAYNEACITTSYCKSMKVNAYNESNVKIHSCRNVTGDTYENGSILCTVPDAPFVDKWVCNINKH